VPQGNHEPPSIAAVIERQHMMRDLATRFELRQPARAVGAISGAVSASRNSWFPDHTENQHRSVPVATMNGLTVHARGLSLRPTTLE
jgi:hypothetical protein